MTHDIVLLENAHNPNKNKKSSRQASENPSQLGSSQGSHFLALFILLHVEKMLIQMTKNPKTKNQD
jgi:hypothetical protein